MNLEKLIENIDMREQILAEWVLTRIKNLQATDPEKALRIEAQLFTAESICYMLDHFDSLFLIQLFKIISPSCQGFSKKSGNLNKMSAKWPEWKSREGRLATGIICKVDPDAAVGLLRDYCEFGTRRFTHPVRWKGVMEGVTYLPKAQKQDVASLLVDKCLEDDRDIKSFCEAHQTDVFKLAWESEHPQSKSLFRRLTILSVTSDSQRYSDNLVAILNIVGLGDIEYMILDDMIEEEIWPLDPDALKFYYDDAIPHLEISTAVDKIGECSYNHIHTFFKKYQNVIKENRIKNVILELLNDKKGMDRIRRKKQEAYFYNMILATLMASIRKTKFDLTGVSTDQAVRLVTLDIKTNPAQRTLTDFLKKQDKAEVVHSLINIYDEIMDSYYGDAHLVRLMGALQYDEFLELLTENLESDFDYEEIEIEPLPDTAEKALLQYRERAVDFLTTHFDSVEDEMAQYSALNIARKVGGDRGRLFVDKYFDAYWVLEKEFLLRTLEAFADEKYLKRLKPFVNKGQDLIDDAYLLISLLNQSQAEELQALSKQYKQKRKDQTDLMESALTDSSFGEAFFNSESKPYINAELECKNCHDRFIYRLDKVFISESAKPYIPQEIECLNCHKHADFEFTKRGVIAVAGELMLAKYRQEQGMEDLFADGPLQYIQPPVNGEDMDIEDAIDFHKRAIEKNPNDVNNYIGLGNFYQNLEQYSKAEQYYNQATSIEPSYIQAYFMSAKAADEAGDTEKAFNLLSQGIPYIREKSFKYNQGSGPVKRVFVRSYCEAYNDMRNRTGSDAPLLEIPTVAQNNTRQTQPYIRKKKIGRNEPCPCGSGKKYKKCCIDK